MSHTAALRVAIDLLHVPSQVRLLNAGTLPNGVPLLLRIAAGDRDAERQAATLADRSPEVVRQAAAFFIEQVLLCRDADSYRVLGADPEASSSELRRNMALLIRWLHPDTPGQVEQSVFVKRVTMAWENVKTPERRAAYDQEWRALQVKRRQKRPQRPHSKSAHKASLAQSAANRALRSSANEGGPVGLWQRAVHFLVGHKR